MKVFSPASTQRATGTWYPAKPPSTNSRVDSSKMSAWEQSLPHLKMPAWEQAWTMGLSMGERRAVTKAMRSRYAGGTKAEKSEVLDALCATTGWHRGHARRALRQAIERGDDPPPPRRPRPTVQVYDEAIIDALRVCWAVLDGPCGKILAPALPALIDALRRCGELDLSDHQAGLLGRMSPATIDRRLAADRAQLMAGKGRSMTKPGSLLKTSIPMKTWTE